MSFSVLILSREHSNEDLKWRAVLSSGDVCCVVKGVCMKSINVWPFKWKPPSTTPVLLLLRCTSWFEILSLWMNSLSATCSQVKASDWYFSILLSAVGGVSNVWVLYKITVQIKRFSNSSPLFEYASLSRLHVLSGAMHTIHMVQQEHEFNHEQIYILICLTASHVN